ncbi:MAG: PEP-utilizing enzyme [Candidatus Kuenenbacteria bacterium]
MIKININPKKQLFKWGPIDGRPVYVDFFNIAFARYQKRFYSWPDIMGYFKKEQITFIVGYQELHDSGEINFKKYILPDKNFKKYYKEWNNVLKKFLDFQKNISKKYLNKLNNFELSKIFKKWSQLYLDFWTIGQLPELSNWGGEQILKRELDKKVKNDDFIILFERLSAPENLSFYQKADLELLQLKKYQGKKLFDEKLSQYQQKYFHILNSYHHTKILSKRYFEKELSKYSLSKAKAKIKELEFLPRKIKQEKRKLIKKYNLGFKIAKIAERLSFCIWWQDLRKFYIFLANHHIDLFLKEFSKRRKVGFDDLHYYNYHKLLELIQNNRKLSKLELKKRFNHFLFLHLAKKNSLEYFSGQTVKKFIKPYLDISVDKNIKEIKGLVVSRGKNVKAEVRILTSSKEVYKMKNGEILVASMTSPDYITAIKKASAIVTDEGGMTCHAAIVSRELEIPCIVGTKIATRILEDGDLVEVNANHGWVRRLASQKLH